MFAGPLKSMLRAGFGIDFDQKYWQDNKEATIPVLGKSPRQLMQTLGTEWGRDLVNPNVWVILAHDQLNMRGAGMVITDMRFDNEAKWVRSVGGQVIHISRKDAPSVNAHSSESGVQRAPEDLEVANDGSIADLQAYVEERFGVVQA